MAKSDTEFARAAISLKLVTQDQANECLRLLAQLRQQGTKASIASVFVQKGYLDRAQVGSVLRALSQPRISHIGQYKLIARVGQGGMGTVYKAKQESLDKIVAVKVLAPALARKSDFVERFVREAQASGRLNHPNIVLGIDAGEAGGYYYFAMEFVDGESLKAVLAREGKLPERRALEIAAAMAAALEHACEHRIVHRDIKPGNILLTADGTPKLADLGLAKEVRTDHSITQAGIPVGTPYYISPEQVRGEQQIDHRADIYALGGTLYHMVTGAVPYDGPTAAVVMTRHLNDPIPDAKAHTPDLSDAVIAIIHRCMAKEPDGRYATPSELREDVEAALAGKPLPHAKKVRPAAPKAAQRAAERKAKQDAQRRKLLIIGAAAAGVLVLTVALVLALRPGKPARKPQAVAPPRTSAPVSPQPRPKTKHKPKSRTPEPKPSAAKPKADAVLRELLDFAATADGRDDIAKRFRDFILDYAGTTAAAKAKAHLAGLEAAWKAEAGFKAAIEKHMRDHQFAKALAALADPPFEKKSAALAEMLDELTRSVKQAAADHTDVQKARGEKLIEQGDLAEAKDIFLALGKLGLPEAAEASRDALARIDTLEAKARERQARRTFVSLLATAMQAMAAGRLDEARGTLRPAKADGNAAVAALLEQAHGDIDRIATLFDAAEAELATRARARKSVRIKGIMRPVTKVENHVAHCTIGRATIRFPIHELSASDIDDLKCAPQPDLIPLLELYRGHVAEAKAALEKLPGAATNPNVKRYLQLAEWIGAIGREDEARQLLAKARGLADRKEWKDAQAAVSQLLSRYGQTAFVEQNSAAIKDMAARCASVLAAAQRDTQAIKPFIDATDRCGALSKALKTLKPIGGWVMDFDNDGRLDIALDVPHAAGDPLVPIYLNRTEPGARELDFRAATPLAGVNTGDEPICWADLDGDGDLDIVCRGLRGPDDGPWAKDHAKLSIYENTGKPTALFRLRPELSLEPTLAKAPGFGGFGFGNIAVLDANGDGRADVLAQYVSGKARTLSLFLSVPGKPFSFRDYSGRAGFVRKRGDDYTTPDYLNVKAWPNYVVFDADGDHRTDFIFNTDTGMVFRNRAGRTFTYMANSTVKYDTYASGATGNNPLIVPAVADYDNDGNIDIFVPQKGRNLLLRNKGDGRFEDAMHTAGPMSTDEAVSLWATWADVNNDGLLDLFVCNSGERNRLYIQLANHAFVDKAEEFGCTGEKGGKTNFVAFGDLDRDGDLDMVILRDSGRSQLLLNPYVSGDNRHYLSVVVQPPLGAIGAKVYLIRPPDQIVGLQQVCRVEGYNGQTSREAFFGVPVAGDYIVRVVLSNGKKITRRHTVNPARRNRLVIRK